MRLLINCYTSYGISFPRVVQRNSDLVPGMERGRQSLPGDLRYALQDISYDQLTHFVMRKSGGKQFQTELGASILRVRHAEYIDTYNDFNVIYLDILIQIL